MNEEQFLIQATVFLAAAVIGVPLLKRLGLSSVLGYIVAGAAIGPWGLKLAGDVESVRAFSEIGIVLLLFLIGLELLPSRLWVVPVLTSPRERVRVSVASMIRATASPSASAPYATSSTTMTAPGSKPTRLRKPMRPASDYLP